MDIQDLVAREAIRELVASYNHYGDTGHIDNLVELFADGASLQMDDRAITGGDALKEFFQNIMAASAAKTKFKSLQHHSSMLSIQLLDDSHARGRCYFSVFTNLGLDHWGRYRDEYVRVGDVWKFASRSAKRTGQHGSGVLSSSEPTRG